MAITKCRWRKPMMGCKWLSGDVSREPADGQTAVVTSPCGALFGATPKSGSTAILVTLVLVLVSWRLGWHMAESSKFHISEKASVIAHVRNQGFPMSTVRLERSTVCRPRPWGNPIGGSTTSGPEDHKSIPAKKALNRGSERRENEIW